MIVHNGGPNVSLDEVVLFPFDDYSIPFQSGLELRLQGYRAEYSRHGGTTRIVLGLGEPGAPDSMTVAYYGCVHQVGDELYMWYKAQGPDEEWFERVCFARSTDGYHWEKPNLGLVAYHGSKNNNLVDLNQGANNVQCLVVFHDPDDPDPGRRFKMAFETNKYDKWFAVAYSADGITWCESPNNPVGRLFEMSGGALFGGRYHLSGQVDTLPGAPRKLMTYVSYDFEHWLEAPCMGLRRGDLRFQDWAPHSGKQIHLGAALWNRGSVIIGFYGQWNGHPSNDRRLVTMDLGLAVSNDALHFREPIPDFPIVSAAEDGFYPPPLGHANVNFPALVQGQGFANIGDETLYWFGPWPEPCSDGVRVASWPRDRLGCFRGFARRDIPSVDRCHFVSAPVDLEGRPARVFLNVAGVGEHSRVTTELLDERFNLLSGYTRNDCVGPEAPGLRQPVRWRDRESVDPAQGRIRIRCNLEGIRPEDVELYAVYLEVEGQG